MGRIEYIQFLIEQINRGLRQQSGHDEEDGQSHTITRDAIREKMILELIQDKNLNGKDAERILPSRIRY